MSDIAVSKRARPSSRMLPPTTVAPIRARRCASCAAVRSHRSVGTVAAATSPTTNDVSSRSLSACAQLRSSGSIRFCAAAAASVSAHPVPTAGKKGRSALSVISVLCPWRSFAAAPGDTPGTSLTISSNSAASSAYLVVDKQVEKE